MTRILFVCVENANRSQMAAAFARLHGGDRVHAESAGSQPAREINVRAIQAMAERGCELGACRPQSLAEISPGVWDAVVTMGCGDQCPAVPALRRLDWALPDPKHLDELQYRGVRDEIEQRVKALLCELVA